MDSSRLVLEGDGANKGALYIAKNYGNTKAGNLANYYAGISYLKLKDFNNAVKFLKEFSTDSKPAAVIATVSLGHAYSELGKTDDAVAAYKKAATIFPKDENASAECLYLAGALLKTKNKDKEALEVFKELKEKYPNTSKGFQVDKEIYSLSIEKNDLSVK